MAILKDSRDCVSFPNIGGVDEKRVLKGALYRIWCVVNRLGDSGVNRCGDTSAFVIPAGQLLLTRRGKTRMYTAGIQCLFKWLCLADLNL